MYAAVTTDYGKIQWKEVPEPKFGDQDVLVKVGNASICGSDEHIFKGDFHPRTSLPLIQGHEFMGKVVDTGKEVKGFKPGDRVVVDPIIWCGECPACKMGHYPACTSLKLIGVDMDGGFGEYVTAKEHMVLPLADNVTDEHAALAELYGVAFHSCRRSGIKQGDTAVVWGTGKVGHCVYQAARTITDNTIFLVDVFDERLDVARQHYQNIVTINPHQEDPVKAIYEHTDGRGVDVAFEVVGHAQELPGRVHPVRGCIQSIHGAGIVCVLGLSDQVAPLIIKELIWKEAKIVASRVSHGEMKDAVEHLGRGNLKPEAVITQQMHVSNAHAAFEELEKNPKDNLKIILNFD